MRPANLTGLQAEWAHDASVVIDELLADDTAEIGQDCAEALEHIAATLHRWSQCRTPLGACSKVIAP